MPMRRGAGLYNTLQSLGFFLVAGGWPAGQVGWSRGPVCGRAAAMGLWLAVAWPMKPIEALHRKAA